MGKRVLIIDDDLYIRDVYEEILKNEGFDVDTAADGVEGERMLLEGGYDLVLLDIMMPKVDGLEVLRRLSIKRPAKPNGPIVVLTNLANDPVLAEAQKLGAKTYIIKSDSAPDEFLKQVKEIIGDC